MPSNEDEHELLRNKISQLELEIESIKTNLGNHSGISIGSQDIYAPHPDLIVNSIILGQDYFRATPGLIQLIAPTGQASSLAFVPEFVDIADDLTNARYSALIGNGGGTGVDSSLIGLLASGDGAGDASIILVSGATGSSGAINLSTGGGGVVYVAGPSPSIPYVQIEPGIWLTGNTSDPTLAGSQEGFLWYRTDENKLYVTLGTVKTELGGGIVYQQIRKAANETVNNSTTLQNDNELLFAVGADEVWFFRAAIIFSGSGTADFKHTFTAPAAHDGEWNTGTYNPEPAPGGDAFGVTNSTNGPGVGTPTEVAVAGWISTSAAGTIQFQWAQNVADATNTVVHEGSWIEYWQVV